VPSWSRGTGDTGQAGRSGSLGWELLVLLALGLAEEVVESSF